MSAVEKIIAAGHQCDISQEGHYWAQLIVRKPPRHLPQPGPYPKLCLPSVVRLMYANVPKGSPIIFCGDVDHTTSLEDWIFLERIRRPRYQPAIESAARALIGAIREFPPVSSHYTIVIKTSLVVALELALDPE